jgi:hypothetical protein
MHPGCAVKRLLKEPPLRVLALATALLAISPAPAGHACGYHDDVSIGRGMLNWTYPEALHVIGAISAATVAKRLIPRESAEPDPFGLYYRATVKALERFAELLDVRSNEASPSFSLVLVEPMLWTHFEAGSNGLRAHAHMPGPRPDDLVVISGQDVIHAIANARLGIDEAYRLGLIRLYGTERQIAGFRAIVVALDVEHRALDNLTLRAGEREQRSEIIQ